MEGFKKWLFSADEPDFPIIEKFSLGYIGYHNGVYCIRTGTFTSSVDIISGFNYECDWTPELKDQPTPYFDSLLSTQMEKDVDHWLEVAMGRSFFDKEWEFDDWQICVFLLGQARPGQDLLH